MARYPQIIAWGVVKHSQGYPVPYYFDTRQAASVPKLRQVIVGELVRHVRKFKTDVIAGAESSGMFWAALAADRLHKPFVYIRKERKKALGRRVVEGRFRKGAKAVLIDDTILRGDTKRKMIAGASRDGLQITKVLIIYGTNPSFRQRRDTNRWLKARGSSLHMLTNKIELSRAFTARGVLTPELMELNNMYMADPFGWIKAKRAKELLPYLRKQRKLYGE